jgi:hypothetical protein
MTGIPHAEISTWPFIDLLLSKKQLLILHNKNGYFLDSRSPSVHTLPQAHDGYPPRENFHLAVYRPNAVQKTAFDSP